MINRAPAAAALLAAVCFPVLTAVAPAQEVRITNIANVPRTQWVDVALPITDAMGLPSLCRFDPPGFIALKGNDVGQHSTMFHVLASLEPNQTLVGQLFGVTSDPAAIPPFEMSDWVADDTMGVFARPAVLIGGVEHRLAVSEFVEVEASPARRVFLLRGRIGTTPLVFDEWLYVYAMQDAVRVEVTFTNSDPRTSSLSFDLDMLWLESRELLELDYRKLLGDVPPAQQLLVPTHASYGRYCQILSGRRTLGRGEQMYFSGWVLCSPLPQSPVRASVYHANHTTVVLTPFDRMTTLSAARFGPAVGICSGWAGKWLAFGMVPELPTNARTNNGWDSANASATAFQALLRTSRDLYAERPRGLLARAGSTGAQEDFGACKGGLAVTVGDPRLLYELGYSVYELFARPFHNREPDCSPLLQRNHPGLRTWSQIMHCPTTSERLGLDCPLPYSWPSDGWSGYDDQHRSQNNFNALLALTGSHALRAVLKDLIEIDLTQVPNRLDSPRAEGRLGIAWANMYLLLDDPVDRANLLAHMRDRVQTAQLLWPGRRFLNDPAHPIRALGIGSDPTFLDPQGNRIPAIIVWEHSIAAMGYYAMWRVTGDQAMHDLAVEMARLVVQHCIYRENGAWVACTAVRYLQGAQEGEALPPSAYYAGSPDIHVGISFWTWIYPAVLICRELSRGVDQGLVDLCDSIVAGYEPAGPNDWGRAEWWAVLPR